MSNSAKFEHARFYDAGLDDWVRITPAEFDADTHDGHIICSTVDCPGSLSFVSAHSANASRTDRAAHFKTNPHGESHTERCPLNPDPTIQNSVSMTAAIDAGKHVVLNINFSCSHDKERGHLAPAIAREKMTIVSGEYEKDWRKTHKGNFSPFSAHSANKLKALAAAYNIARGTATQTSNGPLMVNYLHGILPWNYFFAKNYPANDNKPKPTFTPKDIFDNLFAQIVEKVTLDRAWAPAPALRLQVKLLNSMREKPRGPLYTNFREHGGDKRGTFSNRTIIDGEEFVLQDVIDVRSSQTRQAIQSAEAFSLVATPYIERANIENAQANKDKPMKDRPIHIYWPVSNVGQLIL